MLYQWIRLLKANAAGDITDISLRNQEETTSEIVDVQPTGSSYWYMAQHFPFNNFFFYLDQPNSVATNLEIQYWGGKGIEWVDAVDILDGSVTNGVPLSKSGVVQFSPNTRNTWNIVADTENEPQPSGLSTVNIFNVYWIRFRYADALTGTTSLKRLSYAFTQSQQLDNLDTNINQYLTSFGAGKTDWNDEIMTASIQLVTDFKRRGLIVGPGEILRFDDVSMPCDLKTLILIYQNLGPAFRQKLLDAMSDYDRASSLARFTFDKGKDGFVDRQDIANTVAKLQR